jgi:CheY-like chemotaxis protein
MDIQLPDIDGVEALSRMRADQRTASIPVLAVTAQAMHGDRERFLAAGFDDYIAKPVDIVELVGAVRQHCDGPGEANPAFEPRRTPRGWKPRADPGC